MDFFKDYPAVVGLSGVVLGAVLAFVFNILLARMKRKQELGDKQDERRYKRRSETHDLRIKEARASIASYAEIFSKLKSFETKLIENATPEKFIMFMQEHHREYDEITDLMEKFANNLQSLNLISDEELRDLLMTLNANLLIETTNPARIVAAIGGIEFFNKENELERVSDFSTGIFRLINRIEDRLDKLAEKVS